MRVDLPAVEKYEPPEGAIEFAKKRTEAVKMFWARMGDMGLDKLCVMCYLQAMHDISQCDLSGMYEVREKRDD